MTEVTYYRWRQEFGGLKSDQVKRMKDLEAENARLNDGLPRLALKMATGSGKTVVMAMLIAWRQGDRMLYVLAGLCAGTGNSAGRAGCRCLDRDDRFDACRDSGKPR